MKFLLIFLISVSANAKNLECHAKKYVFDIITKSKTYEMSGKLHNTKFSLHIENTDKPNSEDDYLIIFNKDRNVTLPLTCVKKL